MNTRRYLEKRTPSFTANSQNSPKGCPFAKFVKGLEKHSQQPHEIFANPTSKSPSFFKNFHNLQYHTAPAPPDQNFYSDTNFKDIFQSLATQTQNKENFAPENLETHSKLPTKTPKMPKQSISKSPKNFIIEIPSKNLTNQEASDACSADEFSLESQSSNFWPFNAENWKIGTGFATPSFAQIDDEVLIVFFLNN
jgi:hypothetical protein